MDPDFKLELRTEVEFLKKQKLNKLYLIPNIIFPFLVLFVREVPHDFIEYYLALFIVVCIFVLITGFRTLAAQGAKLDSQKRLFALIDELLDDDKKLSK